MKSENNRTIIIKTFDSNPWRKFYSYVVANNGHFRQFMKLDRKYRYEIINQELKQFHASLTGHVVTFESEKYKTWFTLRWS
jgi:hypothetical protein